MKVFSSPEPFTTLASKVVYVRESCTQIQYFMSGFVTFEKNKQTK